MLEDFERARELDQMYFIESQRQMEEEWQQWEEEIAQKEPARVELITTKKKQYDKRRQVGKSERNIARK